MGKMSLNIDFADYLLNQTAFILTIFGLTHCVQIAYFDFKERREGFTFIDVFEACGMKMQAYYFALLAFNFLKVVAITIFIALLFLLTDVGIYHQKEHEIFWNFGNIACIFAHFIFSMMVIIGITLVICKTSRLGNKFHILSTVLVSLIFGSYYLTSEFYYLIIDRYNSSISQYIYLVFYIINPINNHFLTNLKLLQREIRMTWLPFELGFLLIFVQIAAVYIILFLIFNRKKNKSNLYKPKSKSSSQLNEGMINSALQQLSQQEREEYIVIANSVTKIYQDSKKGIRNVNFRAKQNQIHVIFGKNGSGKSVLLRHLAGLQKIDEGELYINSESSLGLCFQIGLSYEHLTIQQNIELICYLKGYELADTLRQLDNFFGYTADETIFKKKASDLSGGYLRKLSLGLTLVGDPTLVFMDEPTIGLDVGSKEIFWKRIGERKAHTTFIIALNDPYEFEKYADYVYFLQDETLGEPQPINNFLQRYRTHLLVEIHTNISNQNPIFRTVKQILSTSNRIYPYSPRQNNHFRVLIPKQQLNLIENIYNRIENPSKLLITMTSMPTLDMVFHQLSGVPLHYREMALSNYRIQQLHNMQIQLNDDENRALQQIRTIATEEEANHNENRVQRLFNADKFNEQSHERMLRKLRLSYEKSHSAIQIGGPIILVFFPLFFNLFYFTSTRVREGSCFTNWQGPCQRQYTEQVVKCFMNLTNYFYICFAYSSMVVLDEKESGFKNICQNMGMPNHKYWNANTIIFSSVHSAKIASLYIIFAAFQALTGFNMAWRMMFIVLATFCTLRTNLMFSYWMTKIKALKNQLGSVFAIFFIPYFFYMFVTPYYDRILKQSIEVRFPFNLVSYMFPIVGNQQQYALIEIMLEKEEWGMNVLYLFISVLLQVGIIGICLDRCFKKQPKARTSRFNNNGALRGQYRNNRQIKNSIQEILDDSPDRLQQFPIVCHIIMKRYDKKSVNLTLQSVCLKQQSGSIYGLLGQNASGKSTLIKIMTGMLKADGGITYFQGKNRDLLKGFQKRKISYSPQFDIPFPDNSLDVYLQYFLTVKGFPDHRHDEILQILVDLMQWDHSTRQSPHLSLGQRRKLHFLLAFIGNPKVIFLDEPSEGLDVVNQAKMWRLITEFSRAGGVSIISTHNYYQVEDYCKRAGLLSKGQLFRVDTPDNIRREYNRIKKQIIIRNGMRVEEIKTRIKNINVICQVTTLQLLPGGKQSLILQIPQERYKCRESLAYLLTLQREGVVESFNSQILNFHDVVKRFGNNIKEQHLEARDHFD